MSDASNPYEPPATRVADVPQRIAPPRPAIVTLAVFLLVLVMLLEVVDAVRTLSDRQLLGPIGMVSLAVTSVLVGINALLIALIGRGKNWARITFTVFFAVALVAHVTHLPQTFARPPLEVLVILLQLVLQVGAVILIFLPPARTWFHASRE